MKPIVIIVFLCCTCISFSQSAKKLNKQLLAEYELEYQKHDSVYSLFRKEVEHLEQVRKEVNDGILNSLYAKEKQLRKLRSGIYMTMNTIKDLELNTDDVFPNGVNFDSHPKYKLFMKPVDEALSRRVHFESSYTNGFDLEGLPLKKQNEFLKTQIEKFQTYAKYNLIFLETPRNYLKQINEFKPRIDSMSAVYQGLISDLEKKTEQLYQKVHIAEENYRKKGPDGFPPGYMLVFPTIHPVTQVETMVWDAETDGEFEGVVNKEPVFNKYNVYEVVDEPAAFSGGEEAFKKFLKENVFYPSIAKEKGISGTVYLRFIVSETGAVSNITVEKGIPNCMECDVEARRALRLMPDWIPAKKRGKTVHSYVTLPIPFKP